MLLTGSIYLVTDLDAAVAASQMGQRVIALTEQTDYTQYLPDAIGGTILLPPYDAMMFLMDGMYQPFYDSYVYHLATSVEANAYFNILLRSVMVGLNLVFYLPKEEYELNFVGVLAGYIQNCFGVILGDYMTNTPFAYNPAYDTIVLNKLYLDNLIKVDEFMIQYPPAIEIVPDSCWKASIEIGRAFDTIEECCVWINAYKERIKANNNVFLKVGMVKYASTN